MTGEDPGSQRLVTSGCPDLGVSDQLNVELGRSHRPSETQLETSPLLLSRLPLPLIKWISTMLYLSKKHLVVFSVGCRKLKRHQKGCWACPRNDKKSWELATWRLSSAGWNEDTAVGRGKTPQLWNGRAVSI